MRKEHSVKLHILKALSDGDFHSGEALGQELGISRAAIAKHIKGLMIGGGYLPYPRARLSVSPAFAVAR